MVLMHAIMRQFAGGSAVRPGLRTWEVAAQSWKAAQSCRPQQKAHIHRLLAQKTTRFNPWRQGLFRNSRQARWNSSRPNPDPTKHLGSPEPQSFYQRFKKLGKEYGWVVTGVYFGLSALDLPFCFLAVRWLGTERVGRWEHAVISTFWKGVETVMPGMVQKTEDAVAGVMPPAVREGAGWGVEEAEAINKSEEASLWTQFVLAYAIHKSFIFIRVPMAVAVTPKVVKILRGWGYQIGKKKLKTKA